jgi:tRNA(adenine34) deaminase
VPPDPLFEVRMIDDEGAMELAREEAGLALGHGDVPVGAVLTFGGVVVARRHNEREQTGDPLAHAEILAIRDGITARVPWESATLVVTLEPCVMCAGAVRAVGLGMLVFGAFDPRAGAVGSRYDLLADIRFGPGPAVRGGVGAVESLSLLREFFGPRRRSATS